ncbi:PEP-CTERM sorting domain-containing protein [Nostoc sp. FACHB-280]|uniref:PEP-CTERM sorting domain-containing protein n=1 Tax=Nostoc sp. FACHB-280 TaxID=2692839 RepID=UPI00168BA5D5|nr:PEP-CTERM sorting domain-containing protein [Nostoc sp. FACHB-280]MBD2496325.1 PEP-CTERM sorting domain-containing protein [Nostoc sp. FACHB-280]
MKNLGLTNTLLVASAGATLVFAASPSHAAVINISDFTGWQSTGNVNLSNEQAALFTGDGMSSNGVSDAALEAFLGLTKGTLDAFNGQNVTDGSAIKNTLTVQAGDVLTFDWHFQAGDYLPYNDFSFFSVGTSLNRLADVLQVGNFGQTASRTAYTFTTGGTYTIGFGVVNTFDRSLGSNLIVRRSGGDEPVPEPVTIVGSLAAGAFGVVLRYKKKQQEKANSDV